MKKILLAIAFVFTLSLGANAQSYTDSFVDWTDSNISRDDAWVILPTIHFTNTDQDGTPLGSGLLILTALGAGYAKRHYSITPPQCSRNVLGD